MIRPRNEHTLATACEVRGRGYWSGREVRVRFCPAPPATGIRFVRSDLPTRPSCLAVSAHVTPVSLRTNLRDGDASFEMIEHVMAALYGLQVDNCVVEVDGEEIPGMDGSSAEYVRVLRAAGMVVQAAARQRFVIDRTFRVGDESSWIEVSPVSEGQAIYEYHLDYGDVSPIRPQAYRGWLSSHTFERDLAGARTFVTTEQVRKLHAEGVGTHVGTQDLLVFGEHGLIDNRLRYEDECARHKALDLIGDLALAGVELIGRFVSHRGGHRLNAELARALARFARSESGSDVGLDEVRTDSVADERAEWGGRTDCGEGPERGVPWARVA